MLAGILTGLAAPLLPTRLDAGTGRSRFLSAQADGDGCYRIGGITADGAPVFEHPLPSRGHAFAVHAGGGIAVHFARRPGTFAIAIDLDTGATTAEIHSPQGRHFCGHGVFGPDGRQVYATENDFEGGRGVVGVYDASAGYVRIGELPSHGVGPHEVGLLSDGETLVVANGGIRTHPDLPRVKLSLPTMAPSLAYIDRRDGRLLERATPPPTWHQLSIRHLAVRADDTVGIAMQYEGPAGDRVPLVGRHRRGEPLQFFEGPADAVRAMKHYSGSAAFDPSGRVLAVSAPRGSRVTLWDADRGALLSWVPVADGCGLAPGTHAGEVVASSGDGGVFVIDAAAGEVRPLASRYATTSRWDNHIAAVISLTPTSAAAQ